MNNNPNNSQDKKSSEDIAKKAKKTALIIRVGEILSDSLVTLVKWNFFFFITCLPVFTIGPAMAALSHCTNQLAKDDRVQYKSGRNYFEYFRQSFKKALGIGIVFLIINIVFILGLLIYLKLMEQSVVFIPLVSLSLLVLAVVWALAMHLFPQLWDGEEITDKSLKELVKAAAVDALTNMRRTVIAVVVAALALVLVVAYMPATIPVVLTVAFVVPAVFAAFSHTKPDVLY